MILNYFEKCSSFIYVSTFNNFQRLKIMYTYLYPLEVELSDMYLGQLGRFFDSTVQPISVNKQFVDTGDALAMRYYTLK